MPFILQTSGLSKKIGSKALVTNVNIHIPKGEIYGFLGPNGAGKTTVMKMITNLWKPTSGTIEMFGEVLTPKSYEVSVTNRKSSPAARATPVRFLRSIYIPSPLHFVYNHSRFFLSIG